MLKSWTILNAGSEGFMHAAMGAAHVVGAHTGNFIIRRFDDGNSRKSLLCNFLSVCMDDPDETGFHFGIFDDVYMARLSEKFIVRKDKLEDIVRLLNEKQKKSEVSHHDAFILIAQTVVVDSENFDEKLTHECGHGVRIQQKKISKFFLEKVGGVVVNKNGAAALRAYLLGKDKTRPEIYYFPENIVTRYKRDYTQYD